MAYDMYDNGDSEFLDGPIIQPIPDNLVAGDYIEISGFCRGPEVIVELLTDANANLKDNSVLPLRILLHAGGPVQVISQKKTQVQKQDHFVKNGIQDNMAFELCIYALEDGYDIKLNNERVCHVSHLVELEKVGAISMDGDADFTSIEFKDLYGGEDDAAYPPQDIQPGFMRVQESRQSSIRRNAPPILVRSSTRRSQRSNRVKSPPVLAKSQWETSTDLSRPEYDVDRPAAVTTSTYNNDFMAPVPVPEIRTAPSRESVNYDMQRADLDAEYRKSRSQLSLGGKRSVNMSGTNYDEQYVVGGKPSSVLPGEAHRGSYMVLDDDVTLRSSTQPSYNTGASITGSTPNLADKSKKKRSSWLIGRSKKTNGSETDLQGSTLEVDKKKRGSIRDLFKRKKSTPTTSNVDVRQSVSMPNVTYGNTSQRTSANLGDKRLYLGAGVDRNYVRGPVPSSLVKESAPKIAAYVAAQKAVPEFENFSLTSQTGVLPGQSRPTSYIPPAQSRETVYATTTDDPVNRKVKGTAPEMADALIDQGRAEFDHESTLTGQIGEPLRSVSTDRISTAPGMYPVASTAPVASVAPVTSSGPLNLKGSAPELADMLTDRYGSQLRDDTQLTANNVNVPVIAAPVRNTVYENTPQKIKGSAPEMASQLHENYGSRSAVDEAYSLSGLSHSAQTKDTRYQNPEPVYSKSVTDSVYQNPIIEPGYPRKVSDSVYQKPVIESEYPRRVSDSVYHQPVIDTDYDRFEPVQSRPVFESQIQPTPILITEQKQSQRPRSAGRRLSEGELSDVSTVHSDQEFYLEVGRSAYYMERRKSLKRYRSRRTAKQEREARRSMGLSSNYDSQRSSISSLKPGDPVLIPRKRMGTDRAGVDSWLNGHANTYNFEKSKERPRVYAAPPVISELVLAPNLEIDELQMQQNDYKTKLPLPLRSGRSVRIIGHFVDPNDVAESCSILLKGPTGEDATLMLELWSDARLNVYGFANQKPVLLLHCEHCTPVVESEFTLEFHNRDEKLAVTVRDTYTTFVPCDVKPSRFTSVDLEPCDNAMLTHLSVSNTLCLPLSVSYEQDPCEQMTQALSLHTKLTAESHAVQLTFTDEKMAMMKVVLDFVNDGVFVQFKDFPIEAACSRHDIPFVPEQIRTMVVQYKMEEKKVLVQANKKELLNLSIPSEFQLGRIKKALVEGDLVVFDAVFE